MHENKLLLSFLVFLNLKMFSVSTGLPRLINFTTFRGQLLKKIRMAGSNFLSTTYYYVILAKSLCALCLSFLICNVETKTAPTSVGLNVIKHIKCLEQILTHTHTHKHPFAQYGMHLKFLLLFLLLLLSQYIIKIGENLSVPLLELYFK